MDLLPQEMLAKMVGQVQVEAVKIQVQFQQQVVVIPLLSVHHKEIMVELVDKHQVNEAVVAAVVLVQ